MRNSLIRFGLKLGRDRKGWIKICAGVLVQSNRFFEW
jgi:hypothetical protein